MKKIPTLFVRDDRDRSHVTREVTPGCEWVLAGEGACTQKWDGTCVMYDGDRWWARREVKPGKNPPEGWVLVDDDPVTGKRVGWEPAEQSPFAKFLTEATQDRTFVPGTFELVGPKVQGNPDGFDEHTVVRHGQLQIGPEDRSYDSLRDWLRSAVPAVEGFVFHHPDGRMAKIKTKDFAPVEVGGDK